MQNQTKDQILSIVSTAVDSVGWFTVIALLVEWLVFKASDNTLVYTMLPACALTPLYNILDWLMPHKCTDECDRTCPGGEDYDPNHEQKDVKA